MPRKNKKVPQMLPDTIYHLLSTDPSGGFWFNQDFTDKVSKYFGVPEAVYWPTHDPDRLCSGIIAVFLQQYELRKN